MPLCHSIHVLTITTDNYGCFDQEQAAAPVVIILQRQKNEDVIFQNDVSKKNRRTANSQALLIRCTQKYGWETLSGFLHVIDEG